MTLRKTNNILTTTYKELSIQVSLSGLSFCILDTLHKTIESLAHKSFEQISSPEELIDQLDPFIQEHKLSETAYDKITLIHNNELSSFVPKDLFNENHLANYLKYNVKILATDFIAYDELKTASMVNVYVPFTNVNNFIFDSIGEFEFKHTASILVENLLHKAPKTLDSVMFVNVHNGHFEIVISKNSKLILYNRYTYQTKEDFIYYILFTAEQLQLNPAHFTLYLLGDIQKDSELFDITYKYIKYVEFGNSYIDYTINDSLAPIANHRHFILLNSF
ncbi:Protein of unknown function [Zhouia amylolytica]|uniref:DUF3822 domain-containing protein n=2 Tax=Zhouia amylolytica TaxID=376730 RepID=W2UQW4_9FLAO|nr:DUF3822 family protein [Zhouia amylolytica]ETN96408.1 hypothetical protein P278_06760 [Zhouia amylolytica AD3]SFS82856.1 Protein of unknown function [Zhouia amylolytica]